MMEDNKCPICGKMMKFDIELEYDHSPYYCECGYAEGCGQGFSQNLCYKCTEYSHCLNWYEISNSIKTEPVCSMCGKKASELQEYIDAAKDNEEYKNVADYVKNQEGTYNRKNNSFICTSCYVKHGF